MNALIGLMGVALGGALTILKDWWFARDKLKRDATYLSIRVICILESFCIGCSKLMDDDGLDEFCNTQNSYLERQVNEPKLQPFPGDLNWISIDSNLMYRILSLPNELAEAIGCINGYIDFDLDDAFEEEQFQFSKLGETACRIVLDISDRYNICIRNTQHINDILGKCSSKRSQIANKRKESEEKPWILDPTPA